MTASDEKEIKTRVQVRPDYWTIHLNNPTAALEKALECLEQGEGVSSGASKWWAWSSGPFTVAFGLMEGMSSDDENYLFSSDKGGWAQYGELLAVLLLRILRAVQLLQGFLHEEELCKVALTCHFSLDVIFLCEDWAV